MKRSVLPGVAVAVFLLAPGVREAAAQTQTCQNTISLPGAQTATYNIIAKGVYCLTTDVTFASGATPHDAISIQADYVVLDLNGHRVGGGAATISNGISVWDHHDITIKNGIVRGFDYGVYADYDGSSAIARGIVVEGIRAEGNSRIGIRAGGEGVLVRGNQVVATGDGTRAGNAIWARGPGARVVDNQVVDTLDGTDTSDPYGITVESAPGALVEGNQLANTDASTGVLSSAIYVSTESTSALVVGNRITGGWPNGIRSLATNGAKCRDNLFAGVTTMLSDCTDAGNNN